MECVGGGLTADNIYFRVFNLTALGVTTAFQPTSLSTCVFEATKVTFTGTADESTADNSRSSLSASPNPTRDAARVRFATATDVSVFDVTGREVAALYRSAVAADQTVDCRSTRRRCRQASTSCAPSGRR